MITASANSVVDLLGSIATATWTAATLGAARLDSRLRAFAGAWAAIAIHLISRPGSASGDPVFVFLDAVAGAAAGALFLIGAGAGPPGRHAKRSSDTIALSFFAASCTIQLLLTKLGSSPEAQLADFRTVRLLVLGVFAFHLTSHTRRGFSLAGRVTSWTFGVLALLSAATFLLDRTSNGTGSTLLIWVDSIAVLCWAVLALSMAARMLETRTERQVSQAQAEHDDVTGLPRRAPFEILLESTLSRARGEGDTAALFFLDLDRFRTLNESMGHGAGDEVLGQIGDRLRQALPKRATAARVGGDEFVVVWPGVVDGADALRLAADLAAVVAAPMQVTGQEVLVTATTGVSLFPADGDDAATLIDHAHAAARWAKERGPGRPRLYSVEMTGRSRRELSMEMRLRRALNLGEIWVYYQPRLSLLTGKIDGFEALVRWLHPNEGLLAAAAFIDLAESTGLVVPIGRFVLMQACLDAQEARLQSGSDFTVAVNLSAQQLADPEVVDDVRRALRESNLPASGLEVEVTETAAMYDIPQARRVLEQLRGMGVSVALDDFGTGHSALGYLKELPIDRLKIDKCFVRDLESDAKDRFLLRAVIALGRARGLSVTAEGVEDMAQLRFLGASGCHHVQGYLVGTARPALELSHLAGLAPEGLAVRLPRRRKTKLSLVTRQA
ncbi:MAG: bifunctional diguanylate cyclase/phosphodiesterase [Vicinamibacteria bacterium]